MSSVCKVNDEQVADFLKQPRTQVQKEFFTKVLENIKNTMKAVYYVKNEIPKEVRETMMEFKDALKGIELDKFISCHEKFLSETIKKPEEERPTKVNAAPLPKPEHKHTVATTEMTQLDRNLTRKANAQLNSNVKNSVKRLKELVAQSRAMNAKNPPEASSKNSANPVDELFTLLEKYNMRDKDFGNKVSKVLKSAGADKMKVVNAIVKNHTPLTLAVSEGHQDVAEALLKEGAEVNKKDGLSMAPLDYAVNNGDEDLIALLTEKSATCSMKHTKAQLTGLPKLPSCAPAAGGSRKKSRRGRGRRSTRR